MATPEQETKAAEIGWLPKEQWKGDPEKWTDADVFLSRGESFIPFLKKQKVELEQKARQSQAQIDKLAADLAASRKSIETLSKLHEEDKAEAIKEAIVDVRKQLAIARKDGDTDAEVELEGKLDELKEAGGKKAAATPAAQPGAAAADDPTNKLSPEFVDWQSKNKWFGVDRKKTALAWGVAQDLRESEPNLHGTAFFDKVTEEVEKTLNPSKPAPKSKVEGAGESESGASGGETGVKQSFKDLPSEAKAECRKEAKSRVGAGKRYKTMAEWESRFAEIYFSQD